MNQTLRESDTRARRLDKTRMAKIRDLTMIMVLLSNFSSYWRTDRTYEGTYFQSRDNQFIQIDGLPDFVRHGAPLEGLRRAGALLLYSNPSRHFPRQRVDEKINKLLC